MTFTPLIPSSGVAGWNFLQSTYDRQYDAFVQSGKLKNDSEYFAENIGEVTSSEDLLNDRRLLQVAVKAFGLEEEINYRALLQRALNEGTSASDALANTMNDERYVEFSNAFGFGPGQSPMTSDSKAMQAVIDKFQSASFEEAVGEVDETMRTALFAKRAMIEVFGEPDEDDVSQLSVRERALREFDLAMKEINGKDDDVPGVTSVEDQWEDIIERDTLREFFDTTLRISAGAAGLEDDERIQLYRERAQIIFGTDDPTVFFSAENKDTIISAFKTRATVNGDDAAETAKTAELSEHILDQMISRDAALNEEWDFISRQEPLAEFMKTALELPDDIATRETSEAMRIYREKAIEAFGTDDPNVFASAANLDATLEVYRENATNAGLSSSEISSNLRTAETILKFSYNQGDAIDGGDADAAATAEIDAGWYSVMGQTGVPRFLNTALDVSSALAPGEIFSDLTIDEQLTIYKDKAVELFGTADLKELTGPYQIGAVNDAYRTNAEAAGESEFFITYYSDIAERELNTLFQSDDTDAEKAFEEALEELRTMNDEDNGPSANSQWFTIMGQQAMTDFMQVALGLPKEVGQMDIDQAVEVYKRKAQQVLGTDKPSEFISGDKMDELVNMYLTRSQMNNLSSGYSSGSAALMMLRG
ncbi:DUF1217 domain-containing protein [Rhodobacteraceae bacterium R_SAG7]|uniref:DUF1217 domain-containing protein n=1 Tax=Rhodobacterales TaxID=204455 RepID=UPI0000462D14|nr:DUF1217 domain-containing protein [Ruegeria sp. TM1040]ABF65703.1 conserved hypothetical protein [Ruegeria sp. TM1040]MDF9304220.1 DUF1217 domain-containing protein [Tritonibacter mobilis]NKW78429.1 DUF1217 domain-containing protein [Rhodobacteraceae bacterium R_SAG7]